MKSTKHLLLIIIALISLNVNAQEAPPVIINVATAGTLPELIASSQKYQITNLTLTGYLNGTDIRYIREMAGGNYNGSNTGSGKLSVLDLSKARIVAGGEAYFEYTYDGIKRYSSLNSIGSYAFAYCPKLTSITIPNTVTTIGSCAFYDCTGLTYASIPNSVTAIDAGTFYGCTGLTSITIPNSVTTIGNSAFYSCTRLTSITIPFSVTAIGNCPFWGCISLKEFIVSENNPAYKSIEGVVLSKDGTKLIAYPNAKSNTYTIPNSVTKIWDYAFSGCSGLTSVTIPNSVTAIGMEAFTGCTGLTSITIPNTVTTIGYNAFGYCTGLTSVIIPNSVTTIEDNIFYRCTGLNFIAISNSVTTIPNVAFYGCTGLTSITIPNSTTSIGYRAFYGCTGLTSVTIPNSVTKIRELAFYGCNQIKQIYCKGTTPPKTEFDLFSDIYNTCDLYVPKGTYSAYRADPDWGKFKNIIEEVATSISDIEVSKTNVYSENGSIIVKGGKLGDTVDIYSVSGSLLHKIKITDDIVRISVAPQSLYIVKTGDRSFKIAL